MSFQLRPMQLECVDRVMTDLKTHNKIGVIAPTGTGKTEIFCAIADQFIKETGLNVLVGSHLSILTDQTTERFQKRTPHLKTGILQADQTPDFDAQVILTTMQSSRSESRTGYFQRKMLREVGLIIVDECHYIQTDSYEKIISYYPNAKVIGFTASPFRDRKLMTNFFEKISFSISLQEVIDAGYLVQPEVKGILRESGEPEYVSSLVTKIYKDCEMGKKAIVFMQTIEDAKLCRNTLESKGIRSSAITSETTGDVRNNIINAFQNGDIDVLTTVNVLTAGFDAPKVEVIFLPYQTSSPTLYIQRIGRGLRICPEINKTSCRVYAFGDEPTIKSGHYEKLNNFALGSSNVSHETFSEDYENWNQYDKPERYQWLENVTNAIKIFDRMGMMNVARLLDEKTFPDNFMGSLIEASSHLPPIKADNRKVGITDAQAKYLVRLGFTKDKVWDLSKKEAGHLISSILRSQGKSNETNYTIPSGRFKGFNPWEIPMAYRQEVLTRFPDSEVGRVLLRFEEDKRNNKVSFK